MREREREGGRGKNVLISKMQNRTLEMTASLRRHCLADVRPSLGHATPPYMYTGES